MHRGTVNEDIGVVSKSRSAGGRRIDLRRHASEHSPFRCRVSVVSTPRAPEDRAPQRADDAGAAEEGDALGRSSLR